MDKKVARQLKCSKREEGKEGRRYRQWADCIRPLNRTLQEVGFKMKLKM